MIEAEMFYSMLVTQLNLVAHFPYMFFMPTLYPHDPSTVPLL